MGKKNFFISIPFIYISELLIAPQWAHNTPDMAEMTKFQMEFSLHASPSMLYQYISTSSGLTEWFADNVRSQGNKFIFEWGGYAEEASLIARRQDKLIRFHWEESDEKCFFEFRIEEDELTGDVSVLVTDFADANEIKESELLWKRHIDDLRKIIGA